MDGVERTRKKQNPKRERKERDVRDANTWRAIMQVRLKKKRERKTLSESGEGIGRVSTRPPRVERKQ